MATITPGPWEVVPCNHGGGLLLRKGIIQSSIQIVPMEDARLISAAPELLEACKAALGIAWEIGCETEDGVHTLLDDSRGDLYRQLSAAITKATGVA
jgi:hypothetical protein